jgi:hypothetical protein
MSLKPTPGTPPHQTTVPPWRDQKIIEFDRLFKDLQEPLLDALLSRKSAQKRSWEPQRRPKARFWEPPGRGFRRKLAIVAPCETYNIYHALATLTRSGAAPNPSRIPPCPALAAREHFFLAFCVPGAVPEAPGVGKVDPSVPQGLPKDTLKSSKFHEKSRLGPHGCPGKPRGGYPCPK